MMMGSFGTQPAGLQGLGLTQLIGDVINAQQRFKGVEQPNLSEGARPYYGGGKASITEVPSMPEIGSRNWVRASRPEGDNGLQPAGVPFERGTITEPLLPNRFGTDRISGQQIKSRGDLPPGDLQLNPRVDAVEARGRAADMEYSRMSPAEKEALAQKDIAAGTDFRIDPAQKFAAEGRTLNTLKQSNDAFDSKWTAFGTKLGADPAKVAKAARQLDSDAYQKGIELGDSQMKYYLSLLHQKGVFE